MVVKQETEVNEAETQEATLANKLRTNRERKGRRFDADVADAQSDSGLQDPTIQKILPTYQEAVAQEALMLNSGLGENHPKVKAIRATKGSLRETTEDQIGSIRTALEKNLEAAKQPGSIAETPRRNQYEATGIKKSERQLHAREERLH